MMGTFEIVCLLIFLFCLHSSADQDKETVHYGGVLAT